MTAPQREHRDRMEELLAQHVIDGLSPSERAELAELLGDDAEAELDAWEQAAAICDLAVRPPPAGAEQAGLGDDLRARLEARGRALIAGGGTALAPTARHPDAAAAPAPAPPSEREAQVLAGPGGAAAGWWLAAAALLLALLGWWPRLMEPAAVAPPDLAARAERLAAEAPDLVRAEWTALDDPRLASIGGEVLWSDALQEGYMRLRGVPRNDPSEQQYQLWIVDSDRDAEPVDGGVFDVPAGAGDEVIVPIDAKLAVRTPEVFALTLEQPGGVVVSEGPLLAAATVGS